MVSLVRTAAWPVVRARFMDRARWPPASDSAPASTPTSCNRPRNNRGAHPNRVTALISFAADPVAAGSGDATVLLSFFSGGGSSALSSTLRVTGTVAVASPAGSPTCSVIGLVNLEPEAQPSF